MKSASAESTSADDILRPAKRARSKADDGSNTIPTKRATIATAHSPSEPAHLPVYAPSQYRQQRQPAPAFQQPTHLTSFSYSPTRELLVDDERKDEALAFYREPTLGVDLNLGLEHCTWRDGLVDEGLDALLDSLQAFIDRDHSGAANDLMSKIKLITWRGMMTKLLLAVYEVDSAARGNRADGFQMNAMVLGGCLYLEDSNSPTKLAKKAESEASYRQQSYYGYSFEAFSTTSSSSSSSSAQDHDQDFEPPNTNVQWCSIVKTNLGGFRTVLGGEVDCVQPGTDPRDVDPSKYVELKTNIVIKSPRGEFNFERQKLLKHYTQSFLLGVPQVTVGFRTRQGRLTGLQHFKTLEIPRLVRGKPHAWEPTVCTTCAVSILRFIFDTVASSSATQFAEEGLSSTGEPLGNEWPIFNVSFEPSGPNAGLSIRRIDDEEMRRDVLGGKKGEERVGFVLKRWVEGVNRRRERTNQTSPEAERAPAPVPPPAPLKPPIPAPASRIALKR